MVGENHPDTLRIYNSLAIVYCSQGNYKKAEELHEECIMLQEKILGKEHPDTLTSYINLAVVYNNQAKYKEAIDLCLKVYKILFFYFGFDDENVIYVYIYMMNIFLLWKPKNNFQHWLEEKMKETK